MAFNTFTIGSKTFVSIGAGSYQNSTVVYGGCDDIVKITPGKRANKDAPTTCSVSRQIQKDVTTPSGAIERRKMSLTLQVSIPEGFTPTEADTYLGEISTFVDATSLNRILLGES